MFDYVWNIFYTKCGQPQFNTVLPAVTTAFPEPAAPSLLPCKVSLHGLSLSFNPLGSCLSHKVSHIDQEKKLKHFARHIIVKRRWRLVSHYFLLKVAAKSCAWLPQEGQQDGAQNNCDLALMQRVKLGTKRYKEDLIVKRSTELTGDFSAGLGCSIFGQITKLDLHVLPSANLFIACETAQKIQQRSMRFLRCPYCGT